LYEQLALTGFARIFSQNKAEDAANPLWLGKDDNAVMRKNRSKDG
jgi:hypothetical protein